MINFNFTANITQGQLESCIFLLIYVEVFTDYLYHDTAQLSTIAILQIPTYFVIMYSYARLQSCLSTDQDEIWSEESTVKFVGWI